MSDVQVWVDGGEVVLSLGDVEARMSAEEAIHLAGLVTHRAHGAHDARRFRERAEC